VIAYLSSDLFKGIGKKTAESIVNTIGEDAITQILRDESVLSDVPKLSKAKQQQIAELITQNRESEQIMIRLNELGFGAKLSMDIYQYYKADTIRIVENNPYQLVFDIRGVGFQKADQLALQLGIAPTNQDRLKAGLLYLIEEICIKQGHTYLPESTLINEAVQLLSKNQNITIETTQIKETLTFLYEEKKLINFEENVSLPSLYYSELKSTQNLFKILSNVEMISKFDDSDIQLQIGQIEEQNHVYYAPSQKDALENAMKHKVMLLTGGPGTGMTTVIKGIVQLYAELHGLSLDYNDYEEDEFPIALAAPTGRAHETGRNLVCRLLLEKKKTTCHYHPPLLYT
ncbi:helix-hairpin-helix domain-containing protein, partial [Streptococcus suis]